MVTGRLTRRIIRSRNCTGISFKILVTQRVTSSSHISIGCCKISLVAIHGIDITTCWSDDRSGKFIRIILVSSSLQIIHRCCYQIIISVGGRSRWRDFFHVNGTSRVDMLNWLHLRSHNRCAGNGMFDDANSICRLRRKRRMLLRYWLLLLMIRRYRCTRNRLSCRRGCCWRGFNLRCRIVSRIVRFAGLDLSTNSVQFHMPG